VDKKKLIAAKMAQLQQAPFSPGTPGPAFDNAAAPAPQSPVTVVLSGAPPLMPSLAYQVSIQPPVIVAPDMSQPFQTDTKQPATPGLPDLFRPLFRNRQESITLGQQLPVQGRSVSGPMGEYSGGGMWEPGGGGSSPAPPVRSRENTKDMPTFPQVAATGSRYRNLVLC
jgi:hypothetical protein